MIKHCSYVAVCVAILFAAFPLGGQNKAVQTKYEALSNTCRREARALMREYMIWLNNDAPKELVTIVTTDYVDSRGKVVDTLVLQSMPGFMTSVSRQYDMIVDEKVAVIITRVNKGIYIVQRENAKIGQFTPNRVVAKFLRLFFEGECTCKADSVSMNLSKRLPARSDYVMGLLAKSIVIELDKADRRIKWISFESDLRSGVRRVTHEIVSAKEMPEPFDKFDAAKAVYSNGFTPRKEFETYTFHDQRNQRP